MQSQLTAIRKVLVIGASGSFGKQVLDLVAQNSQALVLTGVINSKSQLPDICGHIASQPDEKVLALIRESDDVVVAVPGLHGLAYILAALDLAKRVLSPSKEAIILGWHLIEEKLSQGGSFVPLDTEIYALEVLVRQIRLPLSDIEYLVIGCTGGPFLNLADTSTITPAEALAHPLYKMGRLISINSATLLNKAQEIIEAAIYFKVPADKIKVVICASGLIHAGVVYANGSFIPLINRPTLSWVLSSTLLGVARQERSVKNDILTNSLDFREATPAEFPALLFGWEGASRKNTAWLTIFLAANERSVNDFLAERITFNQIIPQISLIMENYRSELQLEALAYNVIYALYRRVLSGK